MIGRQAYKKNIQSIPKRKAEITCINGEIKKKPVILKFPYKKKDVY